VYCTVYSGNVCVLHIVERYFVCIAQCREALCVYSTVKRGTVCVLHSVVVQCVYTAQCRGALCVCTAQF